jgi:hypothetical protein
MKRDLEGRDHFDLLPYIAILMCMLGCLLLVTMSMAALNMGPGAGEGWTPGEGTNPPPRQAGDGLVTAWETQHTNKTPILVEWDGVTMLIHRDRERQRIVLADPVVSTDKNTFFPKPRGKIRRPGDAEYAKFIDEMAARRETTYALFAIRPSGFDGFWSLRADFESRDIPIGYEPINQDKPVRLVLNKTDHEIRKTP